MENKYWEEPQASEVCFQRGMNIKIHNEGSIHGIQGRTR